MLFQYLTKFNASFPKQKGIKPMEQSNSGKWNGLQNVHGLVTSEIFNGNGKIHARLLITLSEAHSNVVMWGDNPIHIEETSEMAHK